MGEVEAGGGDGSETGSVMEREENKNQGPASLPASPRTSGTKRWKQHILCH